MRDYAGLSAEWQVMLLWRRAMGDVLALWSLVLDGWRDWPNSGVDPLDWSTEECGEPWERGVPLLEEALRAIPPESFENLLGPVMERLATSGPEDALAVGRFAEAWASPHLDDYAAREGHWRDTPSLAQLLPPDSDPAA